MIPYLILLIFILPKSFVATVLDTNKCSELGFDTSTLTCNTCFTIEKVLDIITADECKQCCSQNEDKNIVKAQYITDKRFLRKDLKKMLLKIKRRKKFMIHYKIGTYPTLKLFYADDMEGEDIR